MTENKQLIKEPQYSPWAEVSGLFQRVHKDIVVFSDDVYIADVTGIWKLRSDGEIRALIRDCLNGEYLPSVHDYANILTDIKAKFRWVEDGRDCPKGPWDLVRDEAIDRTTMSRLTGVVAFQNGWVYLSDPETLLAHNARYFFHNYMPIEWDSRILDFISYNPELGRAIIDKGVAPAWIQYITSTFNDCDDENERINSVMDWGAYLVSGDISWEIAVNLHGPTGSGKGTLVRVFDNILGQSSKSLSSTSLQGNFKYAGLDKTTHVIFDEMVMDELSQDRQAVIAESLYPLISTERTLEMNEKHKEQRSFSPRVRVTMQSQSPLVNSSNTNGWLGRVRYIGFLHERERASSVADKTLKRRLDDETPQLMALFMMHWIYMDQRDITFRETPSSRDLRDEILSSEHAAAPFLYSMCENKGNSWSDDVWEAYKVWLVRNPAEDERKISKVWLTRRIRKVWPNVYSKVVPHGNGTRREVKNITIVR